MNDILQSRFVTTSDSHGQNFVFDMPVAWWSRIYEYEWASQFAQPEDVALDAACGVEHPLKFFLLDKGNETYACDLDPRILSADDMLSGILKTYGPGAGEIFGQRFFSDIHYEISNLTSLPYPDKQFDRIYCISVLEHLNDKFNKWHWLPAIFPFTSIFPKDIEKSLAEFRRVLKDDGMIILTFDHPRINLQYFRHLVDKLGLAFAGNVDFSIPDNALYSQELGLRCVRAVLKKA